jgi:NAD(P)-dependent dehydrogenase (short-subunit alcohol dehydrogenase family)
VSKVPEVDEWIKGIVEKFRKLDGALNAAGVIGKLTGLEDEDWDRIMSIDLTGLMYCLRAQLRVIVDKGSIVNVSSVQGVMGIASFPLIS